jgi:hypothetical protein
LPLPANIKQEAAPEGAASLLNTVDSICGKLDKNPRKIVLTAVRSFAMNKARSKFAFARHQEGAGFCVRQKAVIYLYYFV